MFCSARTRGTSPTPPLEHCVINAVSDEYDLTVRKGHREVRATGWTADLMWIVDVHGDGRQSIVSYAGGQMSVFGWDSAAEAWTDSTYAVRVDNWSAATIRVGRWLAGAAPGAQQLLSYFGGQFVTFALRNGTMEQTVAVAPTSAWDASVVYVADVNADGLDDFVSFYESHLSTFIATGDGSFHMSLDEAREVAPYNRAACVVGDFNGDKFQDVSCLGALSTSLVTFLSDGKGYFSHKKWAGPTTAVYNWPYVRSGRFASVHGPHGIVSIHGSNPITLTAFI